MKKDIISEIVVLPQWRPFWTGEWHKLYNVKIRPNFLVKKYAEIFFIHFRVLLYYVKYMYVLVTLINNYLLTHLLTKEYIWISSKVTISVLYQAAILDFCKQNTNEALKLKKKAWNRIPVKNQLKKRYYIGIYVNFFVCYNFLMAPGSHFEFSQKKHVSLLGNFGTFYRSLRMAILTTPEIFSFILFLSIFTPENA